MPYQVIKNNLTAQFNCFLFWNRQVRVLRLGLQAVNSRIPTYNEGSVPKKQELEQYLTVRGSVYWTTGPQDTGVARSPLRHSIILVIK